MKKSYLTFLIVLYFAGFSYGVVVGKYEVFPYLHFNKVHRYYNMAILTEAERKKIEAQNKRTQRKAKQKQLQAERVSEKNKILKNKNDEARKTLSAYSKNADIVFVGDSITQGGYWDDFFPTKNIANRGVRADTTRNVLNRVDSILSTTPNSVFIMLGINDILSEDISFEDTVANYEAIIDGLLNEGTDVFIQSTISCYRLSCGDERVNAVNELNRALRLMAEKKGAAFVGLKNLSSTDGLSSEYTTDGIHLTHKGYKYWVETIKPLVLSE